MCSLGGLAHRHEGASGARPAGHGSDPGRRSERLCAGSAALEAPTRGRQVRLCVLGRCRLKSPRLQ
eukprot:15441836-Alexandrium_andersonii.AAC.1